MLTGMDWSHAYLNEMKTGRTKQITLFWKLKLSEEVLKDVPQQTLDARSSELDGVIEDLGEMKKHNMTNSELKKDGEEIVYGYSDAQQEEHVLEELDTIHTFKEKEKE